MFRCTRVKDVQNEELQHDVNHTTSFIHLLGKEYIFRLKSHLRESTGNYFTIQRACQSCDSEIEKSKTITARKKAKKNSEIVRSSRRVFPSSPA